MSGEQLRLDKWLWLARFFKSRATAAALCEAGRVRLSGRVITKAHQAVRPGDVLTFPQGHGIRVVRVVGLADRRGPAPEARLLYEDLAPPQTALTPAASAAATASTAAEESHPASA